MGAENWRSWALRGVLPAIMDNAICDGSSSAPLAQRGSDGRRAPLRVVGLLLLCAAACEKSPPEIVSSTPATESKAVANPKAAKAEPGAAASAVSGPISLAEATAELPGTGKLVAEIVTDKGTLNCTLFDDRAPKAVANFVGLARGLQPFRDPMTGTWTRRKAYDGTTFHRIIKGFMIQGGDPSGNGTGDPGYVFADEVGPNDKHDRAGLLCMANKGKDTNGMQFFVTDGAATWLDGGYTIFGECAPLEVVHAIAASPVPPGGEKPLVKPRIDHVTIGRQ